MTRFARAKGSKASNERLPEQSTSWELMKKEMHKSQKEQTEKKEREKMNKIRQEKYELFLEENTTNAKTEWAEFPNAKDNDKQKKTKNKSKKVDKSLNENELKKSIENTGNIETLDSKKDANQNDKSKKNKKKLKRLKKSADKISKSENLQQNSINNDETQPIKITNNYEKTEILNSENNSPKKTKNKKPKKLVISNSENPQLEIIKNDETSFPIKNQKAKLQQKAKAQNKNAKRAQKRKIARERDNKEHKRRKPEPTGPQKVIINDQEEEIVKYSGFPVTKTDFIRLRELRKKLVSKGIPKSEVNRTIQLERRKAEKMVSRSRKKNCLLCRGTAHLLSQCPQLKEENFETMGTDICFKCGSTEHTHTGCNVKSDTFKFAQCFVCKEQGHIARQCPDNPRGLYPDGGACRLCGDVTHFKKNCPNNQEKSQDTAVVNMISNNNIESLDEEIKTNKEEKSHTRRNKIIKF